VPVDGAESGIRVVGEQRGVAVADFDRDGRMDLVVAQNGAATRLWRNRGARAGLRVRLRGPVGNPEGWGAVLRLRAGGRWGAAWAVSSSSGYLSQSSAVTVLAAPAGMVPEEVEVRWPGGRTTRKTVPAGATELVVAVGP
jgi:hypothetical protein